MKKLALAYTIAALADGIATEIGIPFTWWTEDTRYWAVLYGTYGPGAILAGSAIMALVVVVLGKRWDGWIFKTVVALATTERAFYALVWLRAIGATLGI